MLQLLKETVSSRHSERLEQIVIALIGVEIGTSIPSSMHCRRVFTLSWGTSSRYHHHNRRPLLIEVDHGPCGL